MQVAEITLIKRAVSGKDKLNQPTYAVTETTVLARRVPVSQSEFFSAGQIGISADYEFIISQFDYDGQTSLKYNGQVLRIYRKYERNDNEIELYCEYAAGLNKKEVTPDGSV